MTPRPVQRRVLSLWFPRLRVERVLRARRDALPGPMAVVGDRDGAQVLVCLNALAQGAGLAVGQPLRDAAAMCPALATHPESPAQDQAFLRALRLWAGKFSPWVAEAPPDGLMVDLTGCAHLFGGEVELLAQVEADCAALGLGLRAGVADTPGAAWALARYAGQRPGAHRNGDAVEQEARATRSRAAKRRGWDRGAPVVTGPQGVIAPPGGARAALAALPLAALRLEAGTVEGLSRLGLACVADLMALPRAGLARRFGASVVRRLDQALGAEAEPVAPAGAPLHFAVRLTLPDPIGLRGDIEAGVDRLLPALCARLRARGRGARWVRLQALRADGGAAEVEVGLARAVDEPAAIRQLLWLKLDQIDPGFGIDRLRLEAFATEPLHATQMRGHLDAGAAAVARQTADTALADLIGRLGARIGTDQVTRLHAADSHIPAKSATVLTAAWSTPQEPPWPQPRAPRPLVLLPPERVDAPDVPQPPARFRWRRRDLGLRVAVGPERILPEWWFDDPAWRSGPRDYWRVETEGGERLWLFYAHGGDVSGGWFCEGVFA